MLVSIVIVNYNVPLFLEQCLHSVAYALDGLEGEVIVVDNASADNSMQYLPGLFPWVRFIRNKENEGFARANNRALAEARGAYVLFLNPDTLICHDTLRQCIGFLGEHPGAGALGVRMLDGNGRFLRESKRSFPDPVTSFYKLTGLAGLFPRSRRFARYHLGYLPENQAAEVDVLAGAFMMVKRSVLEKTGGFDPTFFMYGEDIDLSFRIQEAGYKNYYFPAATIIHFKGESTRKGSMNYVWMFYQAMRIFVEKHYSGRKASLFRWAIKMAIWGRAALSATRRFMLKAGLPLLDVVFMFLSFFLLLQVWTQYIKPGTTYHEGTIAAVAAGAAAVALVIHYWGGLYHKRIKFINILTCGLLQLLVVLSAYSLLPESARFSRGMLTASQLLFYAFTWIYRMVFVEMGILEKDSSREEYRAVVIGSEADEKRISSLIRVNGKNTLLLGRISPSEAEHLPIDEVICCFGETPLKNILETMPKGKRLLFSATGSQGIVGSESANQAGEAYSNRYATKLARPNEKRNKRLADLLICFCLLLLWPFLLFIIRSPFRLLGNIFRVVTGACTWVGYAGEGNGLPLLPEGILTTTGRPAAANESVPAAILDELDRQYAGDYHFSRDIALTRNGIYHLGVKNQ